jgi:hypothetical protein
MDEKISAEKVAPADACNLTHEPVNKKSLEQQRDPESPVNAGHDSSTPSSYHSVDNDDEEPYPEGGRRAWLVVLGSWLALFSSLGLMNILATFQTYVSTHQLASYSSDTIGWIFSLYTFLAFFLGIYIGPIFDKHGPRYLILAGTVCLGLSLMLLSISTGECLIPFQTIHT